MENAVDDRGNVLDVYIGDEQSGRLHREADPIIGIDTECTFAWEGGHDEMKVALEAGYGEDMAIAMLCGVLRGDADARTQAIVYLQMALAPCEYENS